MKDRALIYLRLSRSELEAGEALEKHKKSCFGLAYNNKWEVIDIIEEITSGEENINNRPGLTKLLKMADNKEFDILIIQKLDRLARNSINYSFIISKLKNNNIRVFTASSGNEEHFESPQDNLLIQIMGIFAEFELNTIKSRYQDGKINSVKNGEYIGTYSPYGYKKCSIIKNNHSYKSLTPIPVEAAAVKLMFTLKAKGLSIPSIIKELNKRGYKPQRAEVWNISSVHRILTNRVYAGFVYYGKYKVKTKQEGINKEKYTEVQNPGDYLECTGMHEALIDVETFEKVQTLLTKQPRTATIELDPLSGLCKCQACGYSYSKDTTSYKDKSGKIHRYYRYRHTQDTACKYSTYSIKRNIIIKAVTDAIKAEVENIEANTDGYEDKKINQLEDINRQIKNNTNKEKRLWQELKNTLVTSEAGEMFEQYRALVMDSIKEIQEDTKRLESLKHTLEESEEADKEDRIITLYTVLEQLDKIAELDSRALNIFFKAIIERIEINPADTSVNIVWKGHTDSPEDREKYSRQKITRQRKKKQKKKD